MVPEVLEGRSRLIKTYDIKIPTPEKVGPVVAYSPQLGAFPEGRAQSFYYLFFIEWDLCNAGKDPPTLKSKETMTTKVGDGKPTSIPQELTPEQAKKSIKYVALTAETTKRVSRPSEDPATHRVIYIDVPGITVEMLPGLSIDYTVKQTVELEGIEGSKVEFTFHQTVTDKKVTFQMDNKELKSVTPHAF
jgi:hypothetical protein